MPLGQCLEMQISGIPACLDSSDTCLVRLTLTDNVSEPLSERVRQSHPTRNRSHTTEVSRLLIQQ